MSLLSSLLQEEKQQVALFLGVLREEQATLAAARVEQLAALGHRKLALTESLNALEARRTDFIGQAQGEDKLAMTRWFDEHPEEHDAKACWLDILALAQEAKRLHFMNGELIRLQLEKTQEAIAILTLRQKEVGLYGSDGQTSNQSGSRLVDSA